MTWCNDCNVVEDRTHVVEETAAMSLPSTTTTTDHIRVIAASKASTKDTNIVVKSCPSCGHQIKFQQEQSGSINDLPGLPAGVKFDPTDQELLEHLEGKVRSDAQKLHPLIDEFIPTLEGENGICYTHPEKLPGVNKDGQIRHFFHRPSKAYTTGTRKRRKVHTDTEGGETRWHKTGKTRPVLGGGKVRGFKKILVLYTNYGKQRKPEKTNWVMHQYHLGNNEEEKDGELVVSKVFYQTQPRQCGSVLTKDSSKLKGQNGHNHHHHHHLLHLHHNETTSTSSATTTTAIVDFYNSSSSSYISFDQSGQNRANPTHQLIPHFAVNGGSSFIP